MSLKGMFKNPLWIKGRIRRLEYGLSILIFYFSLFSVAFITSLLTDAVSEEMLGFFAILIFFPIMGLSFWFLLVQQIKRSHDIGNSGWFIIIPFYNLYILFASGDYGVNQYGPNPKGEGNVDEIDTIGLEEQK